MSRDVEALPMNPRFRQVCLDFMKETDVAEGDLDDFIGVEMEIDEMHSRIIPHPLNDELLIIEVDVDTDGIDPLWEELHRLNAIMRFTCNWNFVVDEGDVVLSRTERIDQMRPELLGELLLDGTERSIAASRGLDLADSITKPETGSKISSEGELVDPKKMP